MPKSLQLQIPTPCHENWQNMTPNEQGRHCMACQKTVIDFTMMSDREILNYISRSSSNICGRIANDQLDKPIPFPTPGPRIPRKYFWRIFVPAFLLAGKANARQGNIRIYPSKIDVSKTVHESPVQDTTRFVTMGFTVTAELEPKILDIIRGRVFDSLTNEPLEGVSVKISGTSKGTAARNGNFQLEKIKKKKDIELEFTQVGYKKIILTLSKNTDWSNLKIPMVPEPKELALVTVQAPEEFKRGGMSICYRITRVERVKRALTDTLFRNVKAYPNPVVRGSSINLEVSLKETGDYKLEIMDVSGRVVLVQSLLVNEKKQTSQIATSSTWSSGIYWLRITGLHTKNVYQSKILLQ